MAGTPRKTAKSLTKLQALISLAQKAAESAAPRRCFEMWLSGKSGGDDANARAWCELLEQLTLAELKAADLAECARARVGQTASECGIDAGSLVVAGTEIHWGRAGESLPTTAEPLESCEAVVETDESNAAGEAASGEPAGQVGRGV